MHNKCTEPREIESGSTCVSFFVSSKTTTFLLLLSLQMIISGELNYSDPIVQHQIEDFTQQLENTSYITSPLYTESWLRSFVSYVERNSDYLNITLDSEASFIENLKDLWLFPANPFSLDVKFNEKGDKIIASRFLIQAFNITDTNHEKEMVRDLRALCNASPLNVSVFHPYFVFFDQFELVRPTAIQSMIIGALIMMVVSFIFIPNILCSLWVAFSIISIELGVAGYMALWDVNLDSISMINLIMCIGFSVDFTAHICYTYMSSKAKGSKAKVRESLYSLGLPILQGASSTILGCIALLVAQSYIFLVFFKMIFLVIFFGAMHGLFLLPVLLSLFGPGTCDEEGKRLKREKKLAKLGGNFGAPYCLPPIAMSGPFGSKTFLGAPYKAYGTEEKDLGIGTSGEDSSESSSSKSQRKRQADDDANTRRMYEEGWRRSAKQSTISTAASAPSRKQSPPLAIDMYGMGDVFWKRKEHQNYGFDDNYLPPRRRYERDMWDEMPHTTSRRDSEERRQQGQNYIQRFMDDQLPPTPQQQFQARNGPMYGRRFSDENQQQRRFSDERSRPVSRKYSPNGIYRQNPNRSTSQHNLYHPQQSRTQPYRSSSQNSLRHMGDIRFS